VETGIDDRCPDQPYRIKLAAMDSRVPRVFVVRLMVAYLGLYSAVLSAALVTLALRIEYVDPRHKEASLALAAALGALVALFANPLAGRLSDRTTSRRGRRRPWLIAGTLGGTAGLAVVALVPSIAAITAGWCLAQMCFNASIAALAATVPDQVPLSQRGMVSGLIGFSQRLAVPIGMGAVAMFSAGLIGFLLPAAAAITCICLFALPLKDTPAPKGLPPFSAKEFFGSFWTDPRNHPDFAWVWLTRFLIYFAAVAPAPYLAYYLTSRTGVTSDSVAATVALLITLNYVLSAVTAATCGWLSDRLGRRKVFVGAAGALLAAGLAILACSATLAPVFFAQALLGIGSGLYLAVDMALATEVLPSSQDVGKDLGVINSADVLPQSIGLAAAPALLSIGSGHNYAALYLFTMVIGLLGILTVTRIKKAG
jgi:MFS family permease